jgi:hypothetical protein
MPRRHELTDARRAGAEGLSPGEAGDPGRTAAGTRRFAGAVPYALKTGIPRADPPARCGKPNTARERFDRWRASGARGRVAAAPGDPDPEDLRLDSTAVKAHPVAATGRRRPGERKGTPTPGGAPGGAGAGRRPRPTRPRAGGAGCRGWW